MAQDPGNQYYVTRRRQMLRRFDWFAKRIRSPLVELYDAGFADDVLVEARREFELILPRIPYIGGRANVFTPVMIINGWIIALHRAMKSRGATAEDVVRVCYEVTGNSFSRLPRPLLRLAGWLAFTRPVRAFFKRQAARSQQRRHAEDFVYTVREGGEDDFALEFSECAVNKFYEAQHVEELKPYCNFFDVTTSRLMGMGIDARETIGLGCDVCRLRYKRGRTTVIPERLAGILPDS